MRSFQLSSYIGKKYVAGFLELVAYVNRVKQGILVFFVSDKGHLVALK